MCLISGDTKRSLFFLASGGQISMLSPRELAPMLFIPCHYLFCLLDCKLRKDRAVSAHHCFPVSKTWFDLSWKLKKYLLIHAELVSLALLPTGYVTLD